MEGKDRQERTAEVMREEFHERVERLRGQARELKTFLERSEKRKKYADDSAALLSENAV